MNLTLYSNGKNMHVLQFLSCVVLLILVSRTVAAKPAVGIAPAPSWVVQYTPEDTTAIDNSSVSSGYYYKYYSRQENIALKQTYRRSVIQLLTSEGVQEMSDVSIGFDPAYQKLVFHSITLIRNGKRIRKLKRGIIRVIQREVNMERYLYDGSLTAVVNLTDVRIGDIIDYSYTLTGENPVFQGRYGKKIYLQYAVPMEYCFCRLIIPNHRKIQFGFNNGATQPERIIGGKTTDYRWMIQNTKPIVYDVNTPSWYDPYPSVSLSEYSGWKDVVKQFAPMYTGGANTRSALKRRLHGTILHEIKDSLILRAIRFVQDDIRYLGFENGLNSHRPTAPLTLLAQRFGDCKAKAFLLCEILRAYDVKAAPLLVNSHDGYTFPEQLPIPDAFNHCVVRIDHNNKKYYVDPTINCQGGDLDHIHFPDYRYGLLLRKGNAVLDTIHYKNDYGIKANELFTLDTIGGGALLTVNTRYTGGAADWIRSEFNSINRESLGKDYLTFYSRIYPGIRSSGKISTEDLRNGTNEFMVTETYTIDSIWDLTDTQKGILTAEFYPLSIDSYITGKKSPGRTMPYAISFPVDYKHRTIIVLPEEWTAEDDTSHMESDAYAYYHSVRYSNDTIVLLNHYKTFKDHIPAQEVDGYVQNHNKIADNLSYYLNYTPPSAFRFSWGAAILTLMVISVCVVIAVRIYRNYDTVPIIADEQPLQLGGWLVLIGFGLVISPFKIAYDLYTAPVYFNNVIWSRLFDLNNTSVNMLTGLLMLFELVYNYANLILVILLTVLYFRRRSVFPRMCVFYYLLTLTVLVLDTWLSNLLTAIESDTVEKVSEMNDIARSIIGTIIWVPYLLRSERVRKTFVERAPATADLEEYTAMKKREESPWLF